MANLDDRDKRMSGVHHGMPWRHLPDADGTVHQNDRQHVALMYGGILATAAVVSDGGIPPVYPIHPVMPLASGRPV